MTLQIALTLAILILAVVLFVSERLRVDLVALLVLSSLALTGLLTPAQALSGFSNPAVVTVWAVFILSGGLARTGVARVIGRRMARLAGEGEVRLLVVIMLTAALMSAFMNNVGVAALLLPVVMDLARRTGRPPSKLLMPLAFGCLLGGLTTLIGTPPNIIASDALRDFGLPPFQFFDFAPVGLAVMLAGIAYMALVGRRLLPARDMSREMRQPDDIDLQQVFGLGERLFVLRLRHDSALAGKTLAECRLGTVLGVNVIGIVRAGRTRLAPSPRDVLQPGDRLLVAGSSDRLAELRDLQQLRFEDETLTVQDLVSSEIDLAEVKLAPDSPLLGKTLRQIGFRGRFKVNVIAILRDDVLWRTGLSGIAIQPADTLLVQGTRARLEALQQDPDFRVSSAKLADSYRLHERLIAASIPENSALDGKTLAESHLSDVYGLTVLGITRDGDTQLLPAPEQRLQAGDILLAEGRMEDMRALQSLEDLELDLEAAPALPDLASEQVGLAEVVLSPHTTLVGKTLRQLHFREKYGLTVLAIWREGRAYRTNLRDRALRFGDALLLYGPRQNLAVLGSEPDFLVLTEAAQEAPRLEKAPLAAGIMAGVVLAVLIGWLPISIAAVIGAAVMVLSGSLSMEEAYRYIEWRAVFLIAGMLPLGIAMEQSGAASFLAEGMVGLLGDIGPLALVAGLFILTALAAQVMPTAAVAVLMAPIAINAAADLGLSPHALMMAVAMSASASFLSPVAHPANVLVIGPGGYRFTDYIKVGLPLTLVVLVVVLLVLPIFWPLS